MGFWLNKMLHDLDDPNDEHRKKAEEFFKKYRCDNKLPENLRFNPMGEIILETYKCLPPYDSSKE